MSMAMSNVFFTADHHFGHENIIKYTNRPFSSTDEMDEEMIRRWNEIVGPADTVYHLGDFTLFGHQYAELFFSKLNGIIKVLSYPWHHDGRWIHKGGIFSKTPALVTHSPPVVALEFPEYGDGRYSQAIVLCHYPFAVWDRKHYGAWHLHGHSHGTYQADGAILDVGVDCHNFYPVSLERVANRLRKQQENVCQDNKSPS